MKCLNLRILNNFVKILVERSKVCYFIYKETGIDHMVIKLVVFSLDFSKLVKMVFYMIGIQCVIKLNKQVLHYLVIELDSNAKYIVFLIETQLYMFFSCNSLLNQKVMIYSYKNTEIKRYTSFEKKTFNILSTFSYFSKADALRLA